MSMPSRFFPKQIGLMLYPLLPVMASFPALRTRSISRVEAAAIGGLRVRLPRVEDLLIMKAIARRPKDLWPVAVPAEEPTRA
jgi:hypothetical protein